MSPNTAPVSTEASWCSSPSRITRASIGTADKRRVIKARSTIDASSTKSKSIGSGLPAWWRKPGSAPARTPRQRWMVWAAVGIAALISGGHGRLLTAELIDFASVAAALPVGATNAIRGNETSPPAAWAKACSTMRARIFPAVAVFPVPGPPEMTLNLRLTASSAASRWRSDFAASGPSDFEESKNRSRSSASLSSSIPETRNDARCRSWSANCCSKIQYRRR